MKKYLWLLLLIGICSSQSVLNGYYYRAGGAAPGGCTSDAINVAFETYNGTVSVYNMTGKVRGQGFQCSAGKLSAIEIGLSHESDCTIRMKWGTSVDLTTCVDSCDVAFTTDGWAKFTFATKGNVSASTTYYFGIHIVTGTTGAIHWATDSAQGYANGLPYDAWENGNWNMDNQEGNDRIFRIYLCNN